MTWWIASSPDCRDIGFDPRSGQANDYDLVFAAFPLKG